MSKKGDLKPVIQPPLGGVMKKPRLASVEERRIRRVKGKKEVEEISLRSSTGCCPQGCEV
jgi:hypothetical protein